MIPKIIHYCWFGKNKKSKEIEKCIASWKKHCPDFTLKEWNELNFDINTSDFTKRMHKEKRWAFVSDYARIAILEKYGGVYLDTDMLIIKPISTLIEGKVCVLGEEEPGVISAGMIAAEPNNNFIKEVKSYYDKNTSLQETIPRILTSLYDAQYYKDPNITVLTFEAFYPFSQENIHRYRGETLPETVYGVHLWNYSWGHPLNKLFKKTGLYFLGKKITERLGIKKVLKKIFNFI